MKGDFLVLTCFATIKFTLLFSLVKLIEFLSKFVGKDAACFIVISFLFLIIVAAVSLIVWKVKSLNRAHWV